MPVSLSLLAGAGWQFFDNSGTPLSGGKLYTYVAGTTTPATTYTDATGVQANTNPIILNSAGRVPYEIWLTSGTNYKFILKTSTDTLLGTYDNIRSAATSLDGTGTNNGVAYFNATGAFSSSSNFTFNDSTNALTVAGNISGNNISAGGTLAVTGNSTLSGTLNVTGNTTVTGTIASTGGITSATPAVTQATGDNSTKIATTAFVQAAGQTSKIQPLTASSSGAGLTLTLAPTSLNFRTDTSNTIVTYSNSSNVSITVPNSATLGTSSGVQARLVVLAVYYSGGIRLAVTNLAGGNQLDESNVSQITTSTTGSTATVIYSDNSAGGVPNGTSSYYRVVGFVDVTYSGTWGVPALVQGIGGQALNGIQPFTNAASGSMKLPNGLILKWGTASATIGTGGTITFSSAFTTLYNVTANFSYGGSCGYVFAYYNPTATQFTYSWNTFSGNGVGNTCSIYYIAVGV